MITFISFIEIIAILSCYYVLFNRNAQKALIKYILLALLGSILYPILVLKVHVNNLIALISILLMISIIINRIDRKEIIAIFFELLVSTFIISLNELLITFLLSVMNVKEEIMIYVYLGLFISLMYIFINMIKRYIKASNIELENKFLKIGTFNIVVINLFIFLLFVKMLFSLHMLTTEMIIQIIILCILLVTINVFYLIYVNRKKVTEKKIEINTNLNPLIDDLMIKMKANEHEYNNHLNVIYAMIQVCKEDELKSRAKTYIGNITSKNDVFNQISDVENTIVKAILYNKIPEAHKHNILMEYEIENDLNGIPLDDSELTVVLSNLINNAIESTKELECKEIDIYIGKINDRYVFEISNTIDENKNIDIKKILKYGVSSKGNGRGYGLYNVKSIIDKYKGKINIDIIDDRIQFIVEI